MRSRQRQPPSQKPPPHALRPIPDTVANAEEPEEPEPIQALPLPLSFPPIQTPVPCALQPVSGTIANAEEHEEHFPVLPLPCSSPPISPLASSFTLPLQSVGPRSQEIPTHPPRQETRQQTPGTSSTTTAASHSTSSASDAHRLTRTDTDAPVESSHIPSPPGSEGTSDSPPPTTPSARLSNPQGSPVLEEPNRLAGSSSGSDQSLDGLHLPCSGPSSRSQILMSLLSDQSRYLDRAKVTIVLEEKVQKSKAKRRPPAKSKAKRSPVLSKAKRSQVYSKQSNPLPTPVAQESRDDGGRSAPVSEPSASGPPVDRQDDRLPPGDPITRLAKQLPDIIRFALVIVQDHYLLKGKEIERKLEDPLTVNFLGCCIWLLN